MSIENVGIETGPNNVKVQLGTLTVWFSYQTPIAYRVAGVRHVCENAWGKTTGKHLNAIDGGDKEARAAREPVREFQERLRNLVANMQFAVKEF